MIWICYRSIDYDSTTVLMFIRSQRANVAVYKLSFPQLETVPGEGALQAPSPLLSLPSSDQGLVCGRGGKQRLLHSSHSWGNGNNGS